MNIINNIINKGYKKEDGIYFWFDKHKRKMIRFLVLSLFFVILSKLPYVNLFFSKWLALYLMIVFLLIIFNIETKSIVILGVILVIIALILELMGEHEIGEMVGNYIYGIIPIMIIKTYKENKFL